MANVTFKKGLILFVLSFIFSFSSLAQKKGKLKEFSKELSQEYGDDTLYQVSEEVEQVMWDEKKLFPNAKLRQILFSVKPEKKL